MRFIKCGLCLGFFVRLLPVLLLVFSLLSPFHTSLVWASSDWDNSITVTDKLEVVLYKTEPELDVKVDLKTTYVQKMQDLCDQEVYENFIDTLNNQDGRWVIAHSDNGLNKNVHIGWTTETQEATEFLASPTKDVRVKADAHVTFLINSSDQVECQGEIGGAYITLGALTPGYSVFLSTYPITYPTGYEGEIIPESWSPEEEKPIIKPDFAYQVANKKITAHDYNLDLPEVTPDEGYTIQGYSVEWSLFKCNEDWDDVSNTCDSDLVDHQILLQDKDYTFNVDEYDDYTLQAQYLVEQCYRYPSYPATPDHCFYVDFGTEFEDLDFRSTTVHLNINGSSFTGDTTDLVCDVSGYCELDEQDCSEEPDFFSRLTCQVNKQLNVGVINPSINAIKNLLTSFVVPDNPQCNVPLQNVQFTTNATYPLSDYTDEVCEKTDEFHGSFPIASVLVNGLFAIFMVTMIIAIFNKLTDNEDNDIIQGVK